jgi:hypothetical protein
MDGRVHDVALALGPPPPSGISGRVHEIALGVTPPRVPRIGVVHEISLGVGPATITAGAIWVRRSGQWLQHRARVRVGGQWR